MSVAKVLEILAEGGKVDRYRVNTKVTFVVEQEARPNREEDRPWAFWIS